MFDYGNSLVDHIANFAYVAMLRLSSVYRMITCLENREMSRKKSCHGKLLKKFRKNCINSLFVSLI